MKTLTTRIDKLEKCSVEGENKIVVAYEDPDNPEWVTVNGERRLLAEVKAETSGPGGVLIKVIYDKPGAGETMIYDKPGKETVVGNISGISYSDL